MGDKDKDWTIEVLPEVQAKIDADPELKAMFADMKAAFHQAMDAVKRGQHETFEDAMEAITGHRPERIAVGEAGDLLSMIMDGDQDDDDPTIFADGGITLGLCGNPACFCVHYGLKDAGGNVFADGKLKLEDVPQFVRDLERLADTLKQKARPS